ncbi:ester cyclase, partial [Klebsiella pneumoniae]|uniref:ester cyclase n=1 Tax=Klebsiella pneumoniae TaxID=573 RepID=UPI003C6CF4CA
MSDAASFADLFAENGEYMDPAFGILRHGRQFVRIHHESWRRSIPDFCMKTERIIAGESVVVVQAIGEGTFDGENLGGS